MRTLLINMTRFGDLVQSQAALAGLAREGAVAVACLDNFAAAAGLLDGAEAVLPLPGAGLLADVQDSRPGRGWRAALARLEGWRGTVRAFAPDRVVNLTPSIPVRLLTRLLAGLPPDVPPDGPSDGPSDGQDGAGPTPEVRGFVVDEYGFNADVGGWAAFLHTASNHRGASPFNVVDLFSRVAGLDGPGRFVLRRPGEAAQEAAARLVPEVAGVAPGARGWLAVQLGASEDRRRWPVSHFARAAERLFERRGLAPMLLGSAAETPLADRFRERCAVPALDLTGRTGLDELGAVLTRAELLLTNDTGTMHLAAGLGVPVAAVFLATAQPFDTGPYLAGALSFEPDLDCHPCPFGAPCPHGHACR
ncbi:MAG: glycosyltransferase family 9 protein, partial [Desulfovibrionaceae bacterium]